MLRVGVTPGWYPVVTVTGINNMLNEYYQAASALSRQRKEVAERMQTWVQEKLVLLGMPNIRFLVNIERQEDPQGIFRENGKSYFAYRGEAHKEVIAATAREKWYAEEMFGRFALIDSSGEL